MSTLTPNLLDNVINWIDPQKGLERYRARAQHSLIASNEERLGLRHYNAAKKGRLNSDWFDGQSSPNQLTGQYADILRHRTRDMVRNNPYAERAVMAYTAYMIGTGLRPRPKTGDDDTNKLIAKLFDRWTKECDAEGHLSYYGIQQMAASTYFTDGEVFIRIRSRKPEDGLLVPMQLQLLDADLLASDEKITPRKGHKVIQGIEFNKIGRVVAYHFYREHPNDTLYPKTNISRVPANEIIHLFKPKRPGQVRGITPFACVLEKLKDTQELAKSELVRLRISSCLSAFITRAIDGLVTKFGKQDEARSDLNAIAPGAINVLNPGEDVKFTAPIQAGGYRDAMVTELEAIATGLNIPYPLLTGDVSKATFSSIRFSFNPFQRQIATEQNMLFIPKLCERVYKAFIHHAMLAGHINQAHYEAIWSRPAKDVFEPLKDATANIMQMKAGLKSLTGILSETGQDPEEHAIQLQESKQLMDEYDITVPEIPPLLTPKDLDDEENTSH